jgi:hypothetical protein
MANSRHLTLLSAVGHAETDCHSLPAAAHLFGRGNKIVAIDRSQPSFVECVSQDRLLDGQKRHFSQLRAGKSFGFARSRI